jgi:hypothetical protein
MDDEARLSKALADGAELIVRHIEHCHRLTQECTEVAWTNRDVITAGRSALMDQSYQFIRLASELGTSLSKLKDQMHRQHIAVERLDGPAAGRTITLNRATPETAETLAPGRGEGEGVDKQLDGAVAGHAAAS